MTFADRMTVHEFVKHLRSTGPDLRITFEDVQRAYKISGLQSLRGSFIRYRAMSVCACPLTALYFVAGNGPRFGSSEKDISISVDLWAFKRYGAQYTRSFQKWFDHPWDDNPVPMKPRDLHGYVDGFSVRMALDKAEKVRPFGPAQ